MQPLQNVEGPLYSWWVDWYHSILLSEQIPSMLKVPKSFGVCLPGLQDSIRCRGLHDSHYKR